VKARGVFERPARSRIFWIDYRDGSGKRHRERIGSRAEALEALRSRQREVADGRFTPPRARARARSLTFRELALESLEHKRLRIRPRSYDTDCRRLDAILRRIGAIPAAAITPLILANMFRDLSRNGADPGHPRPEGLSGSTLNRYRSLISSIFTWAIQVGRLDAHPLGAVHRFRENPSRVRYLLDDEEKRLRDVIRQDCPAREAEFDLAIYTGMRKGEQLSMKWVDVDLANGTARVCGKSGVRFVHLNESAKRALVQLERQAGERGTFVSPDTTSEDQTEWPRWFQKCVTKAAIRNFHFHDCRHTFASRLAMLGTDLLTIARLLGHSTIKQTEKYAHLSPSHVRDAVERIGTLPVEKINPPTDPEVHAS
jgi:integrase